MKLKIGSHVSFLKDEQLVGSVKETVGYGANIFMFYTGAPQNTNRIDLDDSKTFEAHLLMKENNIDLNDIVVHAPYIINLANSNDEDSRIFAINFLKQELYRCETLGITKIVLHPGSHVKKGEELGISNIIDGLNQVIHKNLKVNICLETMSGKGSECGYNIEQLKQIIDGVIYKEKVMICLDTCHLHDAGYDLTKFDDILDKIDELVGIEKIACVHVNDSKNEIVSKKDRHANIGFGYIGFSTLIDIIYNKRLSNVPKILETPYVVGELGSYPPYKFEIEMILTKQFDADLIEKIKKYYENN